MWIPVGGLKALACTYHQLVHLDRKEQWQVNADCTTPNEIVNKSWFILPPAMEYYYKTKNYKGNLGLFYKITPLIQANAGFNFGHCDNIGAKCKPDFQQQQAQVKPGNITERRHRRGPMRRYYRIERTGWLTQVK